MRISHVCGQPRLQLVWGALVGAVLGLGRLLVVGALVFGMGQRIVPVVAG